MEVLFDIQPGWVRKRAAGAGAVLPSAFRGHRRPLKRGSDLSTSLTCHRHVLEDPHFQDYAAWRTETSTPCGSHKTFSGVLEDSKNGLSRLSGSRQNADPLGEGYKFRQGPNLHFLHHPFAMRLDGAFGTA
jgi:hypothetical protein